MNYDPYVLERIHNALCFIEDHIHAPCGVADMAEAAGYSLFHFARLFNHYLKISPYNYLIRRRLSMSVSTIKNSKLNLLEIALSYQFDSAEGFSRAFKRMFGINPSLFRSGTALDPNLFCPAFVKDDIKELCTAHYFNPQPIRLSGKTIFGRVYRTSNDSDIKKMILNNKDKYIIIDFLAGEKNWHIFLETEVSDTRNRGIVSLEIDGGEYANFSLSSDILPLFRKFVFPIWLTKIMGHTLPCRIILKKNQTLKAYLPFTQT
ncbi:MAG: helix-turn-helix transcriptional regulator [Spirochaetales bacterium]|nr:helix-turn-helix transcriptional regulator [Spirochaetales bacterium]